MPKIRTLVYGSCVARDVLRVVPDPFRLNAYVARQTIASGFTKPAPTPDLSHVKSAFQRRSLEGDFTSDVGDQIRASARRTDIVLIDIASDRHGVAAYRGGYVSTTPDHHRAFDGVIPRGIPIPFGSERHLGLFRIGATRAHRALRRYGLLEKTLVLGFPFTQRMADGGWFDVRGLSGEETNAKYEVYYGVLEELGFRIAWLPDELALIGSDHAWGPGMDHFIDEAYHWWTTQILELAA